MARHFLKTLIVFAIMIILGLAGIVLLNYLSHKDEENPNQVWKSIGIAK